MTKSYHELIIKYSKDIKHITNIPQKEIEIFLCNILNINRVALHKDINSPCSCEDQLKIFVDKRATGYPLEYIINCVEFYGEKFFVDDRVLIARPETELLVKQCLKILKSIKNPKLLEIGCGSGVISIILSKYIKDIEITATDISSSAIEVSKINAKKHNIKNISFVQSDLLSDIKRKDFDIIVSNPPYIQDDIKLDKPVTYEPNIALYGGKNGDEILKKIVKIFYQTDAVWLVCEIGYDQKESLSRYFKQFSIKCIEFYKDYAQLDRGFVLEKR